MNEIFDINGLKVSYGDTVALKGIDLSIYRNEILAITGPSGSGKTTFLRCLNRLIDTNPIAKVEGKILFENKDIYRDGVNVTGLRRRVGMVFYFPTPLPVSIFENVAYGPRRKGISSRNELSRIVRRSLEAAVLWDEIGHRLQSSAMQLSGGQQQRLSIARILAMEPELILLDEPCSGLDPISTLRIEELLANLKDRYTIVLVTHNVQQAARVADRTAFFLMGEMVECAGTTKIFTNPSRKETEDYILGRFG